MSELTQDKPMIIHELQTESWLPDGMSMQTASTEELYKTMSPRMLSERIDYAVESGVRTIDTWGMEWWYYMKQKRNAPELWNAAKERFEHYR